MEKATQKKSQSKRDDRVDCCFPPDVEEDDIFISLSDSFPFDSNEEVDDDDTPVADVSN